MVSFIERNLRQPNVSTLAEMATLFECTVDDLLKKDAAEPMRE
jgi:transcriptional regulator with XRE-family HTH domain